jgi:hypothetical protein
VRHLRRLLAERLIAAGAEPVEAARTAELAVRTMLEAETISAYRAESWERDAQIHCLIKSGAPLEAVRRLHGMSRSGMYEALRRHLERRRAARDGG